MAGEIGVEGGAGGGTAEPLIDPLLQSFAERYVAPWERRELGRIDSPLYLVPQLTDAAELFERGRQRWRDTEIGGGPAAMRRALMIRGDLPAGPHGATVRDFDNEEWATSTVEAAREAHRLLLTHSSFDMSKPDDLSLWELRELVSDDVPAAALYASAAMRCAQDAADECYRMSLVVEDCAQRWHGVELAALHDADNDQWFDRIRDVLRELADEVAEAREYISTYLGAARTALALASAAENAENLDAAERDYLELWEEDEANKRAVRAGSGAPEAAPPVSVLSKYFSPELGETRAPSLEIAALLAEKAELKKENIERRENDKERTRPATLGKVKVADSVRQLVGEKFRALRGASKNMRKSDDWVCRTVGEDEEVNLHKKTVREHARALGLLSGQVRRKIDGNSVRNVNTGN